MTHTHRFFVSTNLTAGGQASLDGEDRFHAISVLRLSRGDAVELADPSGSVFDARISAVDGEVILAVGEKIDSDAGAHRLTVAQALPRGRKMDLVVEKLSEIGVAELIPLETEKSVARPDPGGEKFRRWRRIARAAAGQAKRTRVMRLEQPRMLDEWLGGAPADLVVLSTEPRIDAEPLGTVVRDIAAPITLLIGPESGFSGAEVDRMAARGVRFARLGGRILRTETAALVASAIVLHHMGEIG